jgi:hypothetical protein
MEKMRSLITTAATRSSIRASVRSQVKKKIIFINKRKKDIIVGFDNPG